MAGAADIARDSRRRFLDSHGWIRFELDLREMPWLFWEQLGEAKSKCLHIETTPIPPGVSAELSSIYLAKGAVAARGGERDDRDRGTGAIIGGGRALSGEPGSVVHC